MPYMTEVYQRDAHEHAKEVIQKLKEDMGDEDFYKFIEVVLDNTKGYHDQGGQGVDFMCDKCPRLLVLYVRWFNERLDKIKKETTGG